MQKIIFEENVAILLQALVHWPSLSQSDWNLAPAVVVCGALMGEREVIRAAWFCCSSSLLSFRNELRKTQ